MISLLLIVSVGASAALIPMASAHTPAWSIPTVAHVQAVPDPIGVGQTASIYMWLDKVYIGSGMENDYRFHNYTLYITDPNGTTKTYYFANISDTTSSQIYSFTPTSVGTYTINFTFPGQAINDYSHSTDMGFSFFGEGAGYYQNDTYLPSSSVTTLTVQQDPIPEPISSYPLPSEYWSRPIYSENSLWYTISSNWLGNGAANYGGFTVSYNMGGNGEKVFPGDAIGPLTSHVMWTKPLQSGGVVGGNNYAIPGDTYFEGSAYSQRYQNPIIVNGKLYYNPPVSFTGSQSGPTTCVDLRTGEILWSRSDVPAPSFAYIYDVQNPNQHGVFPAILVAASGGGMFGSGPVNWQLYDADTGDHLFDVSNIPSATGFALAAGPQGEQLRYTFFNNGTMSSPSYYLCQWNSSRLWVYSNDAMMILSPTPDTLHGTYTTYTWQNTTTYVNNVPTTTSVQVPTTYIPADMGVRYDWLNPTTQNCSLTWMKSAPTVVQALYNDMVICYNGSLPSSGSVFMGTLGFNPYTYFAINLNPDRAGYDVGDLLWMKTFNAPANNVTVLEAGVDPVNRVFVENYRETNQFVGYSLDNGSLLWGPTDPLQAQLDYYGSPASGSISTAFAYGNMYTSQYGGIVTCFDTANGKIKWTYGNGGAGNTTNSGFGVPGPYPTFVNAIGNGVVYTVTTEHTIETPLYKGAMVRALNATDGTEIWTINGYVGEFGAMSFAIADGYANYFNGLDNQIYTLGRGPSSISVEAPLASIIAGQNVVIQGNVVDISSGTQQDEQAARFPDGVPVASDVSMKDWMGYVYQQKPLPDNFTGVTVSIDAIDPNCNLIHIGDATTDSRGHYQYTWTTPNVPGDYRITASFAGTNGYWPSYSETGATVNDVPATTTPTPTPASNTDMYILASAGAIIAVVAIVGAVLALMVRKR
jgi:outer membrane protein assembly factor BamB